MVHDLDFRGKKLRIAAAVIFGVFILAAILLSAGRFWLISSFYNTATGYYDGAGNSDTVINYLVYAAVVIAVIAGVFFMKKIEIVPSKHSGAGIFSGIFGGLAVAAAFVLTLIEQSLAEYGALDYLSLFLMIPVALYFILGAVARIGYTPKMLLGFSVILWSAVNLLRLYFDLTYTINNPAKVSEQLLCIAFMLFFLYESRTLIGRNRPAAQLAIGNAAIILSVVSVLPNVLAYFLYGYNLSISFASQIAELGVTVYVIVRLAVTVAGISFKAPETANNGGAAKPSENKK
ncbi:MAG: hypothetical protein IKV54_06345 [Clostridia bacterium]|nr:hypothetical protein [Clostridia bacterium]